MHNNYPSSLFSRQNELCEKAVPPLLGAEGRRAEKKGHVLGHISGPMNHTEVVRLSKFTGFSQENVQTTSETI